MWWLCLASACLWEICSRRQASFKVKLNLGGDRKSEDSKTSDRRHQTPSLPLRCLWPLHDTCRQAFWWQITTSLHLRKSEFATRRSNDEKTNRFSRKGAVSWDATKAPKTSRLFHADRPASRGHSCHESAVCWGKSSTLRGCAGTGLRSLKRPEDEPTTGNGANFSSAPVNS